ncbi:MAG: two-component regulator propeller domain-containing protein, partial [Vicinamibacterales bacterium]
MRLPVALIIAVTCCAADAVAQATTPARAFGQFQQLSWQERDGLPQNTVLALATTRDGYVWVGTYEGAADDSVAEQSGNGERVVPHKFGIEPAGGLFGEQT